MRKESEFNRVISSSLSKQGGYGYKIPDTFSSSGSRSKAPFDGFGWFGGKAVYWESKFLQDPHAFNFERLEDHQIKYLLDAFENCSFCYALFTIGVNFGRGDIRCFAFKNEELYKIKERKINKQSILKKEFETLPYVKVEKGQVDIKRLLGAI